MNFIHKAMYKLHYHVASYKFFPLTHDESTEFLSSKPQGLYPSRFPIMLDTGLNDYNIVNSDYLHEFYYGDLGCFINLLEQNVLTPNDKSSQDYKRHYQQAKKDMKIECKMIKAFAHKRLVTINDIEKLFHVGKDKANQIWNAPAIVNLSYPVDDTLLSKLRFNVYNSILSKKTIDGFKRVNHNDIASDFYDAMKNYSEWKLKMSDAKWKQKNPYPSEDEVLDHAIDYANKDINIPKM